mmetsp:Transcript_10652/g.26065  ORF Transcript_10652/g.26065 Transcript_10652/m.26065 type:complete len:222 (+) Transcript_10652:1058-1723(+)
MHRGAADDLHLLLLVPDPRCFLRLLCLHRQDALPRKLAGGRGSWVAERDGADRGVPKRGSDFHLDDRLLPPRDAHHGDRQKPPDANCEGVHAPKLAHGHAAQYRRVREISSGKHFRALHADAHRSGCGLHEEQLRSRIQGLGFAKLAGPLRRALGNVHNSGGTREGLSGAVVRRSVQTVVLANVHGVAGALLRNDDLFEEQNPRKCAETRRGIQESGEKHW